MALLQNFIDKQGPVVSAAWLNLVDILKSTIFENATTKVLARVALTLDTPMEVGNGGTGTRGPAEPATWLTWIGSFFPVIWRFINPQTTAEIAGGITPVDYSFRAEPIYDVRRVGVIPNDLTKATANTTAIKALLDPTKAGIVGAVATVNSTGADIYHFNNIVPIRDGIDLKLCRSTLSFSKVAEATDTGSGFLWPIRDFSIEGGTIEVDYDMNGVSTSAGAALKCGGRGDDNVTYRPGLYDSLLASPMGNIAVRDLRISSNVADAGAAAVYLSGGLKGVLFENVFIDGQANALRNGIFYEFGWATSGTTNLRQTSHMSEAEFRNVSVKDINVVDGIGMKLTGSYNYCVDGLRVISAASVFVASPGESLFYRTWAGKDDLAKNGSQTLRRIVGLDISSTGITLTGAQLASGGYLAAIIAGLSSADQVSAQTDLANYTISDITIYGNQVGYGIISDARYLEVLGNVRIRRFNRGMYLLDECTRFDLNGLTILECEQTGLGLNGGSAIASPIRQKVGTIRNSFIAFNSVSNPGAFPGLEIGNSASIRVQGNRFNYETAHDGVDETTQGNAVQLAATATGVVCDSNYVGVLVGGTYAYSNVTTVAANGNTVLNPQGSITTHNAWLSEYAGISATQGDANRTLTVGSSYKTSLWATALTANRTVTLSTTNAKQGDEFEVVRTGLGAFTLDVGGLKTIPNSTAAVVRTKFNGTAWLLTGYELL